MKKKIVLGIILAVTLFVGCKNETDASKTIESTEQKAGIPENFSVTVNAVAVKNDDFQLYYIENPTEAFSEEKSLWIKLKGNDKAQDVTFNLPKGITPTSIRLDFGLNKDQANITLNSVKMQYGDKEFIAKGAELQKYFSPLDPTKIDFATGIMTAIGKDGKKAEPALQPQEALNQEIKKLVQ